MKKIMKTFFNNSYAYTNTFFSRKKKEYIDIAYNKIKIISKLINTPDKLIPKNLWYQNN